MKKNILTALGMLFCCILPLQAQLLKGGGSFDFTGYAPFAGRPVKVYYYVPPGGDLATMPVVFVFEGADRGGGKLAEFWNRAAEEHQFIFVLPHFDVDLYPLEDYQETGVLTTDRQSARDPSLQTSALVDEIFGYIRQHTGTEATRYRMYGHSAGGQFLHRFMLFFDSPYVERAVVASPGWYTFPDPSQLFPYGTKDVPYVDRETIRRYLSKDIILQLGMGDTIRESYLRKTPEAEAQGRNRLERGRTFYQYVRQLAADNGWAFNWQKIEVEGIGHHSVKMAEKALPFLTTPLPVTQTKQPTEVTSRFYPDPVNRYCTPTLSKPASEGFASQGEIMGYLEKLALQTTANICISSLGTTPQGRDIPVIYLGTPGDDKLNIWIQAALHGNEPAGPEAICMLADYLLQCPESQEYLEKLHIALVPLANPDGYGMLQRRSAEGLDLNRDQTKLSDPVSVLLKRGFDSHNVDVALDIHEYTPARKEYATFTGNPSGIYQDVLFLPTGHPNVPAGIREFSHDVLQHNAALLLTQNRYAWGYYFTPKVINEGIRLSKGASSPQSSSTNFALSGALSMFIEIRGIGLGRTSFARRAECGYLVARSMLETCLNRKDDIARILEQAEEETVKGEKNIHVTFKPGETEYKATFVDYSLRDTFSLILPATDALNCRPQIIRARPQAYLLTDTCTEAVRVLEALGVAVEKLPRTMTVEVEEYICTDYSESPEIWENIQPVKIATRLQKKKRTFPPGTYLVYTTQKSGNYVVILLEPESANGFISFRVIESLNGQSIPIYRWM